MQYDVLVVGAGVVGCATAMELGKYSLRAAVIEASEDVCTGTSKANSAIVHAGFDARPGSLMARFNVEGSHAMPKLCERLQIPFRRCGALVLCFNEADRPGLEELLLRGVKNGVHGLRIVEREELHELEPNVSSEAVAALYAPTSGIVCPFELTCAMAENAVRNGVEFFFDTRVESIAREGGLWKLETAKGSFEAPVVINAAGLHSAELNNMVSDKKITITPRKGEYMLLDKKVGGMLSRTVFQLPTKMGKGVLVTPTISSWARPPWMWKIPKRRTRPPRVSRASCSGRERASPRFPATAQSRASPAFARMWRRTSTISLSARPRARRAF